MGVYFVLDVTNVEGGVGGGLILEVRNLWQGPHGLCFIYGFLPTLNVLRKVFHIIPVATTRRIINFNLEEVDDRITVDYFSDDYL